MAYAREFVSCHADTFRLSLTEQSGPQETNSMAPPQAEAGGRRAATDSPARGGGVLRSSFVRVVAVSVDDVRKRALRGSDHRVSDVIH